MLEFRFNKSAVLRACNFVKKNNDTGRCFSGTFAEFIRTTILKNICERLPLNFIQEETPTKVFSSEFYEFFKNNYFVELLQTAGSEIPVRGSLVNKVASLLA